MGTRLFVTILVAALSALSFSSSLAKEPRAASATLGFGTYAPTQAMLTDPRTGKQYRIAIDVDPDVNGRVVDVELDLQRPGGEGNLLAPFGIYHGLQPYGFAGRDLVEGPEKSEFGRVRAIPIRRTATKLIVQIEDAQTRSLPPVVAGEDDDVELTRLRVHVALETKP